MRFTHLLLELLVGPVDTELFERILLEMLEAVLLDQDTISGVLACYSQCQVHR
jgi:hypothetical protein